MRKIRKYCFATLLAIVFVACGNEGKQTEYTEGVTADITAAQMEGRNAAKAFVNRAWKDTMELQEQVLEAKSKKAKYEAQGYKEAAAAYDSAFMSTIKTVRPDLYRALQPNNSSAQ